MLQLSLQPFLVALRQLTGIKTLHGILLISLLISSCAPVSTLETNEESSEPIPSPTLSSEEQVDAQLLPSFSRPEPRFGNAEGENVNELQQPLGTDQNGSMPINPAPLLFVENVGQFDKKALFQVRGADATIYLTEEAIWFTYVEPIQHDIEAELHDELLSDSANLVQHKKRKAVNLKFSFPGSNPHPIVEPFGKIETNISYFAGRDPVDWRTDVPVWRGIRYTDLYPGIDLEVAGENGSLTWRIIVTDEQKLASRSNYASTYGLSMRIAGQKQLRLEEDRIYIDTEMGSFLVPLMSVQGTINDNNFSKIPEIVEDQLFLIYPINLLDVQSNSIGKHALLSLNHVNQKNLVQTQEEISPNLLISKLLGGVDFETGYGAASGPDGSMFVTGETWSADFPTTTGAYDVTFEDEWCSADAFVSKIDSAGQLEYSTFLGGEGCEYGTAIAVNQNGEAFVTGGVQANDFPLTNDAIMSDPQEGFLVKFNSTGDQLQYSSYIGVGSHGRVKDIAIDENETVHMLYQTAYTDGGGTSVHYGTALKLTLGNSFFDYVYTLGDGYWNGMDLRNGNGQAYFVGQDQVFHPTTAIAASITNLGSLVYSISFSWSVGETDVYGIAVDADGYGYIISDKYLTIIDPTGIIQYDEPIFAYGYYVANSIWVDNNNSIYLVGNWYSDHDFPATLGSVFEGSVDPCLPLNNYYCYDIFVVKLVPLTLRSSYQSAYATLVGGSDDDWIYPNATAFDSMGNVYLTGETASPDFVGTEGTLDGDTQAFAAKVSTEQPLPVVPEPSTVSSGVGDACFAAVAQTFAPVGGPINSRTGSYEYAVEDITVSTTVGALSFRREYTSKTIDVGTTISPGWTYNHVTRLIFPTDPEGEPDTVLFKAHTSNRYIFNINGDGTFSAYPGLCATLVEEPGTPTNYVLKDGGQKTYTFDASGKLQTYSDAQGNTWDYDYNASGKLDRINADGAAQYLSLHYDAQGRIDSVSDQTDRNVTYHYDANGDLGSVVDVLQETWTYEYQDHLMTRVAAPGNVTVERTEFDAEGRAWSQFDGQDDLVVELTYNADGTTTVTDALGNTETYTYDGRKTLTGQANSYGDATQKEYDFNFRPKTVTDSLGNQTNLVWSEDGVNLTHVEDALHNQTTIDYGDYNNLTSIIDPLNYETKYFYNDASFPTLPTRIEYPLTYDGGLTYIGTDYEYYQPGNPQGQPAGQVKLVTDALGKQTYYTYTASGRTESVTVAYDTANARTTSYTYDNLGRLTDTTDEAGIVMHNEYNAAGRITKTIRNYDPTHSKNENNIYNSETQYFYDPRANQIAVVDTYDMITRTYYDLANRPVAVVQNLYVNGTLDDINTPLASVPAYDSNYPDRNIRSEKVYDDAGNVIATIDSQGIIARTYYDQANRPEYVFQNWSGLDLYNPVAPACQATASDQNICTQMFYDANGNLIATKDIDGVIMRTYYDELNRAETVVQNLVGQLITNPNPPARGALGQNVRTDTIYDANGNVIATVDPTGVITRTYYDAMDRPITMVENLAGKLISDPTPPDRITGATDANIRTDTFYDQAGNVIATQDPLGAVTRTYYDEANRPVTVVQNLVGQDIYVNTPPARGSGATWDQNVRTDTVYDQFGRKEASIDPLGRETRFAYDAVGQLVKVTANYVDGLPQNDQDEFNIVTEYAYDALGRQIEVTDTLGNVSVYSFDDLGRITTVTQNYLSGQAQNYKDAAGNRYNIKTTYAYDSRGNQIAVTDTADTVTRTYFDELGRSTSVVRNLAGNITDPAPPERGNPIDPVANLRTDTVYLDNGSVDYTVGELGQTTDYISDSFGRLITLVDPLLNASNFEYDANGNRTLMTDAEGISTSYEYDALNRLKAVLENYQPGVNPGFVTNVRTEYEYDAAGNRLNIRDGNSFLEEIDYRTRFTYDAFGRLKTETDPLNHVTAYEYDVMGNRVSLTDANNQTTLYGYDGLNRLELIDYPAPDADVTFDYDALGRRTNMNDSVGATAWEYNNLNLPKLITDPFQTSVSYDYDAFGNRTNLAYGDQAVVYKYDALNRQYEVTGGGLADEVEYGYDASGRLKTVARPGGVSTVYNYFDNGWLQDITHSSGTITLASYQYQYYNDGNRREAIENILWPSLPPTPPTNTPTFTPSATETSTATPTATNTLTPTATSTATETQTPTHTPTTTPDLIFADGFESGNFSAWHWADTDNGDLLISTQAAAIDNYGMQAVINDTTILDVIDELPSSEKHYSTRFYFDPNTISIPSENGFYLISADDNTGYWFFCLYLDQRGEYYTLTLCGEDDTGNWIEGSPVYITDDWQAVEIEWQAASAPGANDGYTKLWVDDTLVDSIENLDNDAQSVTYATLGVLYPVTGTSGTIYFDAFESRRGSHIGLDPDGPPVSLPQYPPDFIFADGFESGNFSAWDWADTDGGDLSISAQAAAVGNYGMQAVIDDITELGIYTDSPVNQTHYSARFYFDPNSVNIPAGEHGIYLFAGDDDDTTWVFSVLLQQQGGGYYSLSLGGRDDSRAWLENSPIFIADDWTAAEIEWQAASAPGANDGYIKLWVNDTFVDSIESLDNDTHAIVAASLLVSDMDNGTSGTVYFDAFESRAGSHIGLDPNGPVVPPPPSPPDLIFIDGFETGDLSAWSNSITDGGDLQVSTAAAYQSNYGLEAVIDDQNNLRVDDEYPLAETHYRARFYFDPNSLVMNSGSNHYIFDGRDTDLGANIFRTQLFYENGAYKLRMQMMNDGWSFTNSSKYVLSDDWHLIEIEWRAASATGTNDGFLKLWLDDILIEIINNIDNDTHTIDQVRLGATGGLDAGTLGSMYFDHFKSHRDTYIGPVAGISAWPKLKSALAQIGQDFMAALRRFSVFPQANIDTLTFGEIKKPESIAAQGHALIAPPPAPKTNTPTPTSTQTPTATITDTPTQTQTSSETPSPTETFTLVQTETLTATTTSTPIDTLTPLPTPTNTNLPPTGPITITYDYDPLNRLTDASYSNGDYYTYTYDAVGNRKTQETYIASLLTNDAYTFDIANRLTDVNGVTYTWDDNGNLLNDGVNAYAYDSANRLTSLTSPSATINYAYNGLGDRLQETVNGDTTSFTMDLNTGLTQALSDGTYNYVYGNGRVAQVGTTAEHFLGDALGSVRQMTDATGAITYARSYDPYGVVAQTGGASQSVYGYTGEFQDSYIKLIYLRSRWYDPASGRFPTKDSWQGDYNRPLSLNRWNYTEGNPINFTDPTGRFPEWCRQKMTKWGYAKCVLDYYHLEPVGSIFFNGEAVKDVKGSPRCWSGPIQYRAPGYIEGYSWFASAVWGGKEIVYDFATMERSTFSYIGGGLNDSILGGGYALYLGLADGLRSGSSGSGQTLPENYQGVAEVASLGADISLMDIGIPVEGPSFGFGGIATKSFTDKKLMTASVYIGVGAATQSIPYIDVGYGIVNYTPIDGTYKDYGIDHLASMAADMIIGRGTPYPEIIQEQQLSLLYKARSWVLSNYLPYYAYIYEEMRNEKANSTR